MPITNVSSEEREIDGTKFEVTKYHGTEGWLIKAILMKNLIPPLGKILDGLKSLEDLSVLNSQLDISGALSDLMDSMTEDQFLALVLRMLRSTRVYIADDAGKITIKEITKLVFDMQFAGNLAIVYKVLAFVVEVNYGDFLSMGGIGERIKSFVTKIGSSKKPMAV